MQAYNEVLFLGTKGRGNNVVYCVVIAQVSGVGARVNRMAHGFGLVPRSGTKKGWSKKGYYRLGAASAVSTQDKWAIGCAGKEKKKGDFYVRGNGFRLFPSIPSLSSIRRLSLNLGI